MKKTLSSLLALLLLSGCKLTVNVIGEGEVNDRLSDFTCKQDSCVVENRKDPIKFELVANPADGFTNIGLLSRGGKLLHATDGYFVHTSVGYATAPIGTKNTRQGYPDNTNTLSQPPNTPNFVILSQPTSFGDNIDAIFVPTDSIKEIYQGDKARCVQFNDDTVECWGAKYAGSPVHFSNIYLIANTQNTICVADDSGLQCWGDDQHSLSREPEGITGVIDIAFALDKACAIHTHNNESKLSCWGRNSDQIPADISNPISVRSHSDIPELMCVTNDSGETCWGENYFGQSKVPSDLTNVTDFSVGDTHTCAIANGEVVCWGEGYDEIPADISNPTSISSHRYGTCVTDDSGVKCWGYRSTDIPSGYDTPIAVTVSRNSICIQDSNALHCNTQKTGEVIVEYANLSHLTSTGSGTACYIDNNNGACIGNSVTSQVLEQLINPQVIAAGHGVLCHYSDAGVGCTTKNTFIDHSQVPPLDITPTGLVVSFYGACAYENNIDNNQSIFQCWGIDLDEEWTKQNRGQYIPPINAGMFSKVESGIYHTCGLSGSKLHCWGEQPPPVE